MTTNTAPTTHGTFTIEHTYATTPAKVFAAFSDPNKKRRWFAEGDGFVVEEYQSDFRVGGTEMTRFRFGEGQICQNDTVYVDIVPDQRIVLAYTMAMKGVRFSASLATVELVAQGSSTLMRFTEQGAFFTGSDGVEGREAGTRQLLLALGKELGA